MNPENKNIRRVGILGAATFAMLGGGAVFLSSQQGYDALRAERSAAMAGSLPGTSEDPKIRRLTQGMEESLRVAAAGGVVFTAGAYIAGATTTLIVTSGRRRPGA